MTEKRNVSVTEDEEEIEIIDLSIEEKFLEEQEQEDK